MYILQTVRYGIDDTPGASLWVFDNRSDAENALHKRFQMSLKNDFDINIYDNQAVIDAIIEGTEDFIVIPSNSNEHDINIQLDIGQEFCIYNTVTGAKLYACIEEKDMMKVR